MLQLTPARTINDLVAFNGAIDEHADRVAPDPPLRQARHRAPRRCGLDSPDHATAIDIGKMIDTLKIMFDFVVVDTSGVVRRQRTDGPGPHRHIILVATLDIPALKGLKLATGTLDLLNFPRDTWKFVLNRADGKVGLTTDEFESTLGLSPTSRSSRAARCSRPSTAAKPWSAPSRPPQQQGDHRLRAVVVRPTQPLGPKAPGSRCASGGADMSLSDRLPPQEGQT